MHKNPWFGKNITEVINVKERMNQLFKDKLLLVMTVLGLLTIVAAAGAMKIQKGNQLNEENPYLNMQESGGMIAQEEQMQETQVQVAGNSNATVDEKDTIETKEEKLAENTKPAKEAQTGDSIAQVGADQNAATALVLNFTDTSKLTWPVAGNIVLDYSMDSTIYFPTLDQYKCNPAIVIQSDVSSPVAAPANAKVLSVGSNEEIGNYVELDFGNDYTAVCGQLKEIQVVPDEYIYQGDIMGYVAEPTKYYSIEGNNVFFELKYGNQPIDALDYLE